MSRSCLLHLLLLLVATSIDTVAAAVEAAALLALGGRHGWAGADCLAGEETGAAAARAVGVAEAAARDELETLAIAYVGDARRVGGELGLRGSKGQSGDWGRRGQLFCYDIRLMGSFGDLQARVAAKRTILICV